MRRRLFGAVLTAAMLVSLVPALPTAAAATQLPTPTVEWVTENKTIGDRTFQNGQVVLTDIPESMPNYRVEIKDAAGNIFDQYEDGFGGGSRTVQEIWVGWYTDKVMPSGTYTASVTYLGDNGVTYTDSETATTQPYTYTAPGASYAVPTGVAWNGANFAYTVEEAAQDQGLFMEFAKVQAGGTYQRVGMRADSVQYAQQTNNQAFLERFNERVNRYGPGEYVFRIRVISYDITATWHSGWSDWSDPRYISGADEGLTGSLNGIIQNLEQNPDNKQTAVNAVQALDQEKLLQELSADQDGTGVAGQLADLEQKLGLTATVELAENSGLSLETSKVQVVGAGLNAQNLTAPTFTIDKPAADLEIPNIYKNTVQLDFSLPGAATNQDGTLKVPIQITMPVPEGIDPARLRIIHFRDDGTREEFTPHTFQAADGTWMARFAVNHLSPFVFAEERDSEATITVEGTTTYYDTLTQALSVAQSGQTVTLLKDIDNSVDKEDYTGGINYSLKAGTTLDGGGHTISGHVGVHIPAAGATVQNVKFLNIHNNTVVDQDTCDYYGWDSKTGNQSAIYASKLTGTAVITGCTFDNIDWDAIQITPAATTAEIVIKNNVFRHTASTGTQLRYVHVEHDLAIFSGSKINELTITDNQFYDTENPNNTVCSIGVWYVNRNTVTLKVDGNYIETPATAEVDKLTVRALYPMRSQATVDKDDIAPVAYYGSEVYFTLQEAIDKAKTYVYLMADAVTDATIPADRKISFYAYWYDIGTLTNNGELAIYGSDFSDSSKIVNNGTLALSGNAATVYQVENNGTLKITSGATYDLSKITGSGTVTITGGTFSTQPSADQLEEWYIAKEQSDQTYKVSKMSLSEAVDAGMVAASGSSGSTLDYYRSVTQGLNTTEKQNTVLHQNWTEKVVISTPMEKYTEIRVLNSNGYTFTGSITINDGCGSVRLYGKGNENEITLTDVNGELLYVGGNTTAAKTTIKNAQLDTLDIVGKGDCTVEGGQYGTVITEVYYKNSTTIYTPVLSITGGFFASDTVTVTHSNGTPDETVPLSDYVAAGYTVVAGTGDYPYQVVPQSADAAVVVPAAPSATAPEGNAEAEELATAIEGTGDLVSGSGLDVAANTQANANTVTEAEGKAALEDNNIQVGENDTVTIVVQPYMDVAIEEVSMDSKTLKLNITPRYNVVATTADLAGDDPEDITVGTNAAVVEGGQELAVTQPVEVKLPLPAGFAGTETTLYVQHETGGKVYYYQGAVSANSLSFTNAMGFSSGTPDTFTVLGSSTDVVQAGIGDVYYATLQEAVDAAKDGQTVTVLAGGLSASVTGEERTILLANGTGSAITVTLNGTPLNVGAGETGEFTYTAPTPEVPSGGGSSVTYYSSTVEQVENGTVTVSPKSASKGTTVTITVTADEGYVLDTITVTDKDGKTVTLTDKGNGKYTFTMPVSKVTVKALFKAEPQEALPFTDVAESAWYYDAVAYVYEKGIMTGTNDGTTFSPAQNLTRGMMARILYNLEGSPDLSDENLGYPFADVPGDAWYADGVYWARQNGIVDGYGGNTFGPEDPITREQMAAILYNYAKFKGEDMTATVDLTSFADDEKVSGWAVYAMKWAVAEKLIQGSNNSLNPLDTATRAEVAQLFMNLLER